MLTTEDLERMGLLNSKAGEWAGEYTFTLQDGRLLWHWVTLQGQPNECEATYEVVENVVRFTYLLDNPDCAGEVDDIQWRLDDDGLHLHLAAIKDAPLLENRAYFEAKPWQKGT